MAFLLKSMLTNDIAGNTYSIKNIGSGTAKLFFAQAREKEVQEEE